MLKTPNGKTNSQTIEIKENPNFLCSNYSNCNSKDTRDNINQRQREND
jgi:hypothetical protein